MADDDPVMLEVASTRLADAGYAVVAVGDGEDAFARLAADGADLVISDVDMPRLDGFALTRKIRAMPRLADLPVIVVTGSDHPDAVESAFAAGATSFLAKPMNWALFGHSVRFVLRASADRAALKDARDLAEAGVRFKDSLMSVMSHELRTPLNAIIGFGQILAEQFERERDYLRHEYADYIVDGGKRLLNSVSDMLLASDARTGPISLNEVDCTIGEIVEYAVSAAAKSAGLTETEIVCRGADLQLEICCDRILMTRALTKLIDNAVKFSPRHSRVTVGATRTSGGDVVFFVEDEGPGVPEERVTQLTQPFFQGDMSLKRSKEGLGLGLPLVGAIAAAHGALLKLTKRAAGGTCAVLVIPASRVRTGGRRLFALAR